MNSFLQRTHIFLQICFSIFIVTTFNHAWAIEGDELREILETIDDRQANSGDYKALLYLEQHEKGKEDLVYEMVVYRRDVDDKMMMLFLKPKTEFGKGYIRVEKNLWMYDPTTGKWERRTERERIGGTDSRRSDFDASRLAAEYTPEFEAEEKVGDFNTNRLLLKVKSGIDTTYPTVRLWVDRETGNLLKRQDYALSGKAMRTILYPRWNRVYSDSKKQDVWVPAEMRIYDEVVKDNYTIVITRNVDLKPLDANLFTKAWLESKSR